MQNSRYLVGKNAPLTKVSGSFPTTIDENLSLGLDIGVGSCGQALIQWDRTDDTPLGQIGDFPQFDPVSVGKFKGPMAFLGVRAFDVPEVQEKTCVKLKNPQCRQARLMRRTILRRSKRMHKIRMLLKQCGLLPKDYSLESDEWKKQHESATPLQWRVEGLDRLLTAWEFSAVLLHLAKHRGFKSNRKAAPWNPPKPTANISKPTARSAKCGCRMHVFKIVNAIARAVTPLRCCGMILSWKFICSLHANANMDWLPQPPK